LNGIIAKIFSTGISKGITYAAIRYILPVPLTHHPEKTKQCSVMAMTVEIKNGKLHIEIDLEKPTLSSSGKTLVVASTHGNMVTTAMVDGKPVTIGLNAYIKK
jgi:hypothetical protein